MVVNSMINVNNSFSLKDLENISDNQDFIFDQSLSASEICDKLSIIYDDEEKFYRDHNQLKQYSIILGNRPSEDLVLIFKFIFSRENLIDPNSICNINMLIGGYNTLDDSVFQSNKVFFSDIENLIDTKLGLQEDINKFQTALTTYFLACLKSMSKVEYTYLDNIVEIPEIYKKILSSSNFLFMSQVMIKADNIKTSELPLIKNAYPIIMSMSSYSSLANELLNKIDFN